MSVNGVSMMFGFASLVIYVPIGCRYSFINNWQPLLAKTTATCSLLHPENECQWSINSICCCILGNQGIALIFVFIKELIDRLYREEYTLSKVKHRFQINWYCKLQSIQKHIPGCWKRDFHKILFTFSKNKSNNWICGCTCWATGWPPAQFRPVGSWPSNHTRVDSSGLFTTRTISNTTYDLYDLTDFNLVSESHL